jgi:hypothetical protein
VSYNITAMKVRSIHLELPLTFDFQHWLQEQPRKDKQGYENYGRRWCLEAGEEVTAKLAKGTWKLGLGMADITLSGTIQGDKLIATKIDCRGDGSGYIYSDIILPLFEAFHGNLNALIIWENGDTIKQVTIQDGTIEEEEME